MGSMGTPVLDASDREPKRFASVIAGNEATVRPYRRGRSSALSLASFLDQRRKVPLMNSWQEVTSKLHQPTNALD